MRSILVYEVGSLKKKLYKVIFFFFREKVYEDEG